MPQALAKNQPFQNAAPLYKDHEIRMGKEQSTTVGQSDEYLLYSGKDLPPLSPGPAEISEQPANSMTASHTNKEEQPTLENLREKLASSVFKISRALPAQDLFILLQKWEGTVTQVTKDSFIAQLTDLSESGPNEEAEFPIEEIPFSDRRLIAEGAVFYWCIGYVDTIAGQRIRASVIRFRRLPAWTAEELTRARREAQQTKELLDW